MKANYDRKSSYNAIQGLMKDRGKIEDLSVPELIQLLSKEIILNCSEYCMEALDQVMDIYKPKDVQTNKQQYQRAVRVTQILDSCALQIQNALKADEKTIQLWRLVNLLFKIEDYDNIQFCTDLSNDVEYAFIDFNVEYIDDIIKLLNRPEVLCENLNTASYNAKRNKSFILSSEEDLYKLQKTLEDVKKQHINNIDNTFLNKLLSQVKNTITYNKSGASKIKIDDTELASLKSKLTSVRHSNKNVTLWNLCKELTFRDFQMLVFIMYYKLVSTADTIITPRDTLIAHKDYKVYKKIYNSKGLCDFGLSYVYRRTRTGKDDTECYSGKLVELTKYITELTMIIYVLARAKCERPWFKPNILGDQVEAEITAVVQAANGRNLTLSTETSHAGVNKYRLLGVCGDKIYVII